MKDDTISRAAAVKTVKKHYRGIDNDLLEVIAYEMEELPSAQPTLYGYDIKHLAFVATIMAKKGVSPEEAVTIFRDVNRVIEMMLEDMKEMQENALKQTLKKPWERGQDNG